MRSRVEIVADVADGGRPVLARARADGAIAARATGPGEVHLVGTAAGPLNGDDLEVTVVVRPGARLSLRGVAATLALPGRAPEAAAMRFELVVEDGGTLDLSLPPLVVCRGALLRTVTVLELHGTARADLTEFVVLGRHGEAGGDWTGRLLVDRDHRPVLRNTQRSDVLRLADSPARAVLTHFLTAGVREVTPSSGDVVRCSLASGDLLVTAVGPDALRRDQGPPPPQP